MKKYLWIVFAIVLVAAVVGLAACDSTNGGIAYNNTTIINESEDESTTDNTVIVVAEAAKDTDFDDVEEATGDFAMATEDGNYTQNGNVYTIDAAGTYTLSGSLVGQIVVDVAEGEVTLELNGVTIEYGQDSPIKVLSADKVEISAKKNTDNVIKDTRSEQSTDDDNQGKGAIYAKCDLKIKGNGTIVVEGGYKNGIHTSDDLTIKNVSLKVTAVDNAIKGNDSITIESGSVVAISTKGDGVKTENTDVSSKGNQRGTISIQDGALTVYAAGDGIQAAYNVEIAGGTVTVYTGSYSSYTASGANTTSYKGIKAGNEVLVSGGNLVIHSYDDGLHADYGTSLENGTKSTGNITISGGSIEVSVYSPTKSTMGGRMGPGGWGGQQSVKGSDGIHADNTLTISGGTIQIDSAFEGLEATHIVIEGGETNIYATDDGINAGQKLNETPTIVVSGGYLDVTVPTNGDTDGIDSNGTYTQTGGVVIVKGPGNASGRMGGGAFALDTDRGVTLRGGTLILFGGMENTPSTSGMTKTVCSSSTISAGTRTVTVGGNSYTTTLKSSCGGCVVYSDAGNASLK